MSYAMQHFLTLRELQKAAFKALMAMPREASQELEAPTESGSDNKQNLEWGFDDVGRFLHGDVFLSTCHCQAFFFGANPLKLLG